MQFHPVEAQFWAILRISLWVHVADNSRLCPNFAPLSNLLIGLNIDVS